MAAALGLLAMIVAGRGGQVDVSMREVMLSQLNYRAAAWLNDGAEPRRYAGGAHSHYVPAQLFPAAGSSYLALFITHDRFWRAFAAAAGIDAAGIEAASNDAAGAGGFSTMAERSARREEVLSVVTEALATDTAEGWEVRLRAIGVPAVAVRSLPDALASVEGQLITAGGFRLVGNPIRVDGHEPAYGAAPALGEHGDLCGTPGTADPAATGTEDPDMEDPDTGDRGKSGGPRGEASASEHGTPSGPADPDRTDSADQGMTATADPDTADPGTAGGLPGGSGASGRGDSYGPAGQQTEGAP
jgi:hypothetical protein